jgi:hypothetical protein
VRRGPALALLLALVPATVGGAVLMTQAQALEAAFPGARIERRSVALTPAQVRAVQQRARVKLPAPLVTPYLAFRGDTLLGTAFFETRTVRTMPAVLMAVIGPDSTIRRVDVLAFHEPPDYRPPARWLERFRGHRVDDRMWPGRDLPALSGASLSARAVTESARLAEALFEVVVAPRLPASGARP